MEIPLQPEPPEVLAELGFLFREYFDLAEKKRRWSIRDDVPWKQCNRNLPPAVADVLQTFVAVELYLPDYLGKLIPQVRANRGRAWMLANWGYEECKHSMVLEDWLIHSKSRTDEQLADAHSEVFAHEWNLPYDNGRAMLCYTTFQELATRIHYHNLRRVVIQEGGCPALEKALMLVAIDEAAHADFFRKLLAVYLKYDRPGTLEQIRRVINTFKMPALHMLADSRRRENDIKNLRIFDEDIFVLEVYEPLLQKLGIHKSELRRKNYKREMVSGNGTAKDVTATRT
ncbi:MAG: acyl-ACP desaturase [Planctomycetes bacterium]|nr:acyl-ACP desaturase [Planctomycetota bacterium]